MSLRHRLLNLFRRTEVSQAIDDELQFHIDERADELMAQGFSEPEARAQAARQFGNSTFYKESTRELDLFQTVESVFADVRYAVRSLRHSPAFTAAVATLALGIGATTAIFSVVRTVWLRPLPYNSPNRVVRIWEKNSRLQIGRFSASVPNFLSWRERSRSFESLVGIMGRNANLTDQGDPERVLSLAVTARFFDTLGIRPVRGRSFAPDEDAPGRGRVAMLSERLWRRYAGDPDLIGRTISFNGETRTVIGIAPADMGFSNDIDVWEPLTLDPSRNGRGDHFVVVLGRLNPDVSVGQAEAELNQVAAQLEREFPSSNRDWRVRLAPALEWIVNRETRSALIVLLIAVGLLLIVACVNVANLLLARASSRVQEFGVRQALGAGRGRLMRQLATESLVLASAGGACGLLLALLGVVGLRAILPANVPRASQLSLDFPVLAAAVAVTFVTGLVFGLVPAWVASRLDVQTSIRSARGATSGSGRLRLQQVLVAGEFALASMLVGSAGLLLASFQRLQAVELGFQPQNVLTARLSLPGARYSGDCTLAFPGQLERELNAIPGMQADADSARYRLNAFLTVSFALLALALGAVGVAGVVSYSVIRRTAEMAIRMALGATPTRVVHSTTISGLRVCVVGLVAGLAGASALGRAMAGLLYQVRPDDPAIFSVVATVLLAAALLASWLPARRIARIDPVAALRKE